MGNCCLVRRINFKSDGRKFYECPHLIGKDLNKVFNILNKSHPKYKIISKKTSDTPLIDFESRTVYMYFDEYHPSKIITNIEIFP